MKKTLFLAFTLLLGFQLLAQEVILPKKYYDNLNWLVASSNAYSGVLNPRQTWELSYKADFVTEEYYWDNELTVSIRYNLNSIAKAAIEDRFSNSIVLYPTDPQDLEITRYEDGIPTKIEGEYYNLMVQPEMKEEALRRMKIVLNSLH